MSDRPRNEGDQGDLGDFLHSVGNRMASEELVPTDYATAPYRRSPRNGPVKAKSPLRGSSETAPYRQRASKRRGEVPLVPLVPLLLDRIAGGEHRADRQPGGDA